LNPLRAAVNGWGRGLMSYFGMGSRHEKGWEPLFYTVFKILLKKLLAARLKNLQLTVRKTC